MDHIITRQYPVLEALSHSMLAKNPKKWFWKAIIDGNLEMLMQCASLMGNDMVDWNWCMADAAYEGNMSIVKYAESMGANAWNWCMLKAAQRGHLSIVEYAATHGASEWNTCMALAAEENHLSIVEYAAACGANNWDECIARADKAGYCLIETFLEQCKEQQLNKN